MPKDIPEPSDGSAADGWLVEITMPRVHAKRPAQILFAAAVEDADAAVEAVRRALGGLHCAAEARCRLSARALARLAVRPGEVKSI